MAAMKTDNAQDTCELHEFCRGPLEILNSFKDTIPCKEFNKLAKCFSSVNMFLVLAKSTSFERWKQWFGGDEADIEAHLMFNYCKDVLQRQSSRENETKPKSEVQLRAILEQSLWFQTVLMTTLPVYEGSEGSTHRNSHKALHLKTNWDVVSEHLMYQIEFRGHLYCSKNVIFAIAVGYINPKIRGLSHCAVYHVCNGATVSCYVAKDEKVAFKLDAGKTDWHASDLTVNLIGKSDCYHKKAWNIGLKFVKMCHSEQDL